ncbi:hypothetical protein [Variovorax paradoxus]|uniref:hypothetical protein n=1 Tax=Variovorax paradoxus TaxID=34073 RepID=UPI0027859DAB|nr:hypothetical protein [Variovorax paradoxus]MDQ0587774.1 hypothetical protein [Variovorax paradoxus]
MVLDLDHADHPVLADGDIQALEPVGRVMRNDDVRSDPGRFTLLLQFIAFGAILLGLKLWLIHSYGNEVPFWDQWDAEAARLYQPFLRGELSWLELFSPHNEHRIFTTRVLGLLLLAVNGLWSPLLEMVVNAVLHVLALGTAVWLMSKAANKSSLPALLLLGLLLFGIPFGWENTLAGFQAQFYFVLLFSVLSIWWLVTAQALSRWWWLGVLSAITAYFSLASGVFALAAASLILLGRFVLISRDKRELAGAVLLLVLFLAGASATPVVAPHAQLKAVDARHFFEALSVVLAWPLQISPEAVKAASEWPLLKEWLLVMVRNLPAAVLVCCVIWKRPLRSNPVWFLVALAVWLGGQAAAVAYGRSNDALSSRYLDLHAMGVLVNLAALVAICTTSQRWLRGVAVVGGGLWLLATVSALADTAGRGLSAALAEKRDTSSVQESNVKNYLADKDGVKFRALPFLKLPYPDAGRLAGLLDSPDIRNILPKNLQAPLQPVALPPVEAAFERGGAYPSVPPCHCDFWGSFGAKADIGMGETFMRYDPSMAPVRTGAVFMLKVAGYPATAGRIDIIQGGKTRRLRFAKDPRETWVERYISVHPDQPFTIRLVDQSPMAWLAVSQPVPAGRFDPWVSAVLSHYGAFLGIGAAALGLLFLGWLRPGREKSLGASHQELAL